MMSVYMGRMGAAARTYATALSMMMFILLAMHFYLQAWSQKQAETWVATWEKTYHAHVGQVNLHMLRGALKLKNVRWQSDDVNMDIPILLVHGIFAGTLQQVKITDMTMHDPHLQFSQAWIQKTWQHKNTLLSHLPWSPMLASLHAAKVYGLHASLLGKKQDTPVLNCQWSDMPRAWSCDGQNQHAGTLQVKASGQSGHAVWTDMQDDVWMQVFGLPSQTGLWQGEASWQADQISGQAVWASNDASQDLGRVVWHGEKEANTWQTRLYFKHTPLHMFANKVPHLFGQAWQQGFATGNVDMLGKVMTSDVLMFEDVWFQGKDTSSLHLDHIQLSHVQLDTYSQIFKAESMEAKGGTWHFQNLLSDAQQNHSSPWTVMIPKISWQGMAWQDMQHDLMLSDVYGDASWQGKDGTLHAHQANKQGLWDITIKQQAGETLGLDMDAEKVPLRLLRSLLPKVLQTQGYFNGDVGFHLQGHISSNAWQLNGDINIEHFSWQHADGTWQAAFLDLQGAQLSSDHPFQVTMMNIQDWTGLVSIQPWMQNTTQNSTVEPISVLQMPFWLGDWEVEKLHFSQGYLSIGQEDKVWFTSDFMDFSPVQPSHVMDVNIQGHIGEGVFQWQGQWSPWLPKPWFDANIHLKNALPFVAKDWLHLSALPSFTQGRISLEMNIHPQDGQYTLYAGDFKVHLKHAQLEQGLASNPRFEALTGYAPHALFQRIAPQGSISTKQTFEHLNLAQGFQVGILGDMLLSDWLQQSQQTILDDTPKLVHDDIAIRLHAVQRDSFKHNERVRLRQILHALQAHRDWYVVLNPMLGQSPLNEDMLQRIRQTQRQIEHFLVERGVSVSRILPRFPLESQRSGDMIGIQLQMM
ncbi:MAG: hypothetical protein Q9M15_08530 [Mariprofundaceae bacterium]|nr:hypothetical protein [Mariprofundaceae bacterium]